MNENGQFLIVLHLYFSLVQSSHGSFVDIIPLVNLFSSRLQPKTLKMRIYKKIILPVVLYGCKTWSLTLREEHRLRVFENRVPRRIFGLKRDEVTGEWRKLHNEEDEMGGPCSTNGGEDECI
jgi:hypothetical protein